MATFPPHLALLVVAFIMLLLPFSMSLLCIQHVYSLANCCRVFSWVDKLKPSLIHTLEPSRTARFWPGLLLIVRLLLSVVHAIDYENKVISYYIVIGACLFISATDMTILFRGVYKKHFLNIFLHFELMHMQHSSNNSYLQRKFIYGIYLLLS